MIKTTISRLSILTILQVGLLCSRTIGSPPPPPPPPPSSSSSSSSSSPKFAALFVFGDSLVDIGNNNYLSSLAKANYVPYGVDYPQGPTGRFSNGKTVIDSLGELLGIPPIPPFANPYATGKELLHGVNFASAAAGILDETGQQLGQRYSLSKQVQNFETTMKQVRKGLMMNGTEEPNPYDYYLNNSLAVLILGSNDYLNNYLLPEIYPSSSIYKPDAYADLLVKRYQQHILALQHLGLRKFFIPGVGPLGCIPNQRANRAAPPHKCVSDVNAMVMMFNTRLVSLINQLNRDLPDATFIYGDTYNSTLDILNNPSAFGFSEVDDGCCGVGIYSGQVTCLPLAVPCSNRDQYVFWDAFHPTQAVNKILALKAYNGPLSCFSPPNPN